MPSLARATAIGVRRIDVRHESEPVEIIEHLALGVSAGTLPIVIFDAQQDSPAERHGQAPDVDGIDDVPEVQRAGQDRREPRQRTRGQARGKRAGQKSAPSAR